MSAEHITWVGMDAHKESIKVAAFFPERPEPVEWSETDEALRDLCRCRDDVRVDLLRARHRLSKSCCGATASTGRPSTTGAAGTSRGWSNCASTTR